MTIHPKVSRAAAIQAISEDCFDFFDLMGVDEVRRYMREFPRDIDFRLVDYGEMRVYYDDIRDLFAQSGYPKARQTRKRDTPGYGDRGDYLISDSELWRRYQSITRQAAIAYTDAN